METEIKSEERCFRSKSYYEGRVGGLFAIDEKKTSRYKELTPNSECRPQKSRASQASQVSDLCQCTWEKFKRGKADCGSLLQAGLDSIAVALRQGRD